MTCNIDNAETVNCGCSCDGGSLVAAGQLGRPIKTHIEAYAPLEDMGNYIIDFNMSNGTSQIWTYTVQAERDAVLVNVDLAMNAQTV